MKRFLVFLVVLAVALAGLYVWWQRTAERVISEQVRQIARNFFVNPANLTIESDPVKMTGLRSARVPKLVVSGDDLVLRDGTEIASVKLVMRDIDVSGPPFHFDNIAGDYYSVTVTDQAVTNYLRKRGIKLNQFVRIPLDTLAVSFSKRSNTTLQGQVMLPLTNKAIPLTAHGSLAASSKDGQVDFRVKDVKVKKLSIGVKQVTDSLYKLNPLIDLSTWPIISDIKAIETGDGFVTFRGRITGIRPSLLP